MRGLFKDTIKETLRGKSLPRILINNRMKETEEIKGRILDLASGTIRPSYYRFLKVNQNSQIVSVDISDERKPDIKTNLENLFPFKNEEFNYVFCFNLLEHIFNHRNLINESYRVLRVGGKIIGTVPFLGSVHGDPDDYFRYTKSALKRLFEGAGFRGISIEALGYGPFSVSYYMLEFILPRILRIFALFPAILLDKLIAKIKKIHNQEKYVLMYYFECIK